MTDEEYLRACGWHAFGNFWERARIVGELRVQFALAEAVAAQVAEDRARAAFVAKWRAAEAPANGPLFEAHPLYGGVRAVRSGLLTVRADDGQEWVVPVECGASLPRLVRDIEATIANQIKR